eukprot:TRINITY_DN57645_c0_g1_i1.p1 TRINITY_DN57645_c0_g1~~TRINITY_DN57645_c0_g1_i1.p1  ORF type:complete len:469 (+),score=-17.49 TRINITY_DN57645_c0_g1_i1:89-1495(+)
MLSPFFRYSLKVNKFNRLFCINLKTGIPQVDNNGNVVPISSTEDEIPVPITYEDISRAYYRIANGIRRSPCEYSVDVSEICSASVYLKRDYKQMSGSFKERGARNALLLLTEEQKKIGVVAASAGNHALALAYHGRDLKIPVTCVMPETAPFTKVNKCRKYDANVVLHGQHILAAKEFAQSTFQQLKYINGYDDKEIISGAGTLAIEILEQCPNCEVIVVPVGGAGLIAGVSLAVKTLKPNIKVIGVEPESVASYAEAIKAGRPIDGFKQGSLADGLAVPVVGTNAFHVAKKYVDKTCVVSEKYIALAVLRLLEMEKIVVEGGGAITVAAMLPGGPLHEELKNKQVVCVLGGANIDTTVMGRVIDRGLAVDQRLVRITVTVSDRPGGIAALSAVFHKLNVSIKDIYHERAWLYTRVDQVMVKCILETTGSEHAELLFAELDRCGYVYVRDTPDNVIMPSTAMDTSLMM